MATCDKCPKAVYDMAERIIRKNHWATLGETGVKIDFLFVRATRDKNGIAKGPAIKLLGVEEASSTRVTNLKQRAAGAKDAVIEIDGDAWADWCDRRREAVIDEAIERLEPVLSEEDENGNTALELDDLGRPKLKVRPPEFLVAGFHSIVERHGEFASVSIAARSFTPDFEAAIAVSSIPDEAAEDAPEQPEESDDEAA